MINKIFPSKIKSNIDFCRNKNLSGLSQYTGNNFTFFKSSNVISIYNDSTLSRKASMSFAGNYLIFGSGSNKQKLAHSLEKQTYDKIRPEDIDGIVERFASIIINKVNNEDNFDLKDIEKLIRQVSGDIIIKVKNISDYPTKEGEKRPELGCFVPSETGGTIYFHSYVICNINQQRKTGMKNDCEKRIKALVIDSLVHEFTHSLQYQTRELMEIQAQYCQTPVFEKAMVAFNIFEKTIKKWPVLQNCLYKLEEIKGPLDIEKLLEVSNLNRNTLTDKYIEILNKSFKKVGIITEKDKKIAYKLFKFRADIEEQAYKNGLNASKKYLEQDKQYQNELISVLYSDIGFFIENICFNL